MSDNSKEPAAPARVVMTGRVTLLVQSTNVKVALNPGEDVRKKLAEPLKRVTATRFDLADKTAIVIVFPSKAVSLNDAFNVIGKLVAVEGILTSANDPALVAVAGMKGVKQVPLLVAEKVTWLDDKNKVRFPAENRATIEGVADKAEIKFGATSAAWAIRNADARIPLTLTKDVAPPKAGSKVLASGLVRVVEGQPLLEADKVESLQR